MMTSSNGNIFCVTGPLWGEPTGHRWIPPQRPVTRSFWIFFGLCLNKRFSDQSRRRRFQTPSRSLWRHCKDSSDLTVMMRTLSFSALHSPQPYLDPRVWVLLSASTRWCLVRICEWIQGFLTHWGRNKMANLLLRTFSKAFARMKMATSHYWSQRRSHYLMYIHMYVNRLQWVNSLRPRKKGTISQMTFSNAFSWITLY